MSSLGNTSSDSDSENFYDASEVPISSTPLPPSSPPIVVESIETGIPELKITDVDLGEERDLHISSTSTGDERIENSEDSSPKWFSYRWQRNKNKSLRMATTVTPSISHSELPSSSREKLHSFSASVSRKDENGNAELSAHERPLRRIASQPEVKAETNLTESRFESEASISSENFEEPEAGGERPKMGKKKRSLSFFSRMKPLFFRSKDEKKDDEGEGGKRGRHEPRLNASEVSSSILPSEIRGDDLRARYIKVKTKNKRNKHFNRLFLAQELFLPPQRIRTRSQSVGETAPNQKSSSSKKSTQSMPGGAIWALRFNKDGKYLAVGGQDRVVRIWRVLMENDPVNTARSKAPIFLDEPIREYRGHTADILDLNWSRNNFLLSSSMDKTVRLWHISRPDCLVCFQHLDFVTSVAFHPKDDRFFLSGSLDCKLRLWNIPEKKVAFWNELPEGNFVTAVGFTLDGRLAVAGSYLGLCLFYETEGLKYHTQISVSGDRRRLGKGKKITGIEAMPRMKAGEEKLLITSNDSRIRLYNVRDKSLEYKYKGLENSSSQIRASFSDDGRHVICGSEDRYVHVWEAEQAIYSGNGEGSWDAMSVVDSLAESMDASSVADSREENGGGASSIGSGWLKKGVPGSESFETGGPTVTCAVFAPARTRLHLARMGDPVFTYTIPPPTSPASAMWDAASVSSSLNGLGGGTNFTFPDGNIIVTADNLGVIRVYRNDCGIYPSRPSVDNSDTVSVRSSRSRRSLFWLKNSSSMSVTSNTSTPNGSGMIGRRPRSEKSAVTTSTTGTWKDERRKGDVYVDEVGELKGEGGVEKSLCLKCPSCGGTRFESVLPVDSEEEGGDRDKISVGERRRQFMLVCMACQRPVQKS
ncbi:uncharacterized protein VTP21DRAFT_1764 [Calcarisporiella thermophila]|uniref:uncharacterized protein n=1 Tax=Calcarisporiella thermophila TaxID=911321 RepID=UPI0037424503